MTTERQPVPPAGKDSAVESLPALGIAPTAPDEYQEHAGSVRMALPERIGNYLIGPCVGSGGMGQVFEAHRIIDEHTSKRVAIKVPLLERLQKAEAIERAFQELRAVAQVKHPGIVTVIDWGTLDNGVPYIVMEFLDGELLFDRLQRLRKQGHSMTIQHALHFVRQIASAMDAAHAAKIIHRDLKPSNVMLVADPDLPHGERVKVMDFGLAKILTKGERSLTLDGVGVGTHDYMSPEQRHGRQVTPTADVYSLGIMMDQMLCTQSLQKIHPTLAGVVESMVNPDPLRRPTMREVVEQIDLIAAALSQAHIRRRMWKASIAATILIGSAALSLMAYQMKRPTVRAKGSGTVIEAVFQPFQKDLEKCANIHLNLVDQGSGQAIQALTQHDAELGLSSSYVEPRKVIDGDPNLSSASGTIVAAIVVAIDELVFLVHDKNPIRKLPQSAIQKLLFIRPGETAPLPTTWKELGLSQHFLSDHNVRMLLPRGTPMVSGTRSVVEQVLRPYPGAVIANFSRLGGPDKISEEVAADPAALGLSSQTFVRADTPVLSVLGDEQQQVKIKRPLWVYIATSGSDALIPAATCQILTCLLSDSLQNEVSRLRLERVPADVLDEQRTMLGIGDKSCRIKAHADPWKVVVIEPSMLPADVVYKVPSEAGPHR